MRNFVKLAILLLASSIAAETLELDMTPEASLRASRGVVTPTVISITTAPTHLFGRKLFKARPVTRGSSFEMTVTKELGPDGKLKSEVEGTKRVSLPNGQVLIETVNKPIDSDHLTVERQVEGGQRGESLSPFDRFMNSLSPNIRQLRSGLNFADLDEFLDRSTNAIDVRQRRVRRRKNARTRIRHKHRSQQLKKLVKAQLLSAPDLATHRLSDIGDENAYTHQVIRPSAVIEERGDDANIANGLGLDLLKTLFNGPGPLKDLDERSVDLPIGRPVRKRRSILTARRRTPRFRRHHRRHRVTRRHRRVRFSGFPLLNTHYGEARSRQGKGFSFPRLGHRRQRVFEFVVPIHRPASKIVELKLQPLEPRSNRISLDDIFSKLGAVINPI